MLTQTCQLKKQLYFPLERIHCKEKCIELRVEKNLSAFLCAPPTKFQQNECILQNTCKSQNAIAHCVFLNSLVDPDLDFLPDPDPESDPE